MAIKDYEFWFIVGTQHLYGEEIFADINAHAKEMCDEWSAKLPVSYTHLTLPTTPYV